MFEPKLGVNVSKDLILTEGKNRLVSGTTTNNGTIGYIEEDIKGHTYKEGVTVSNRGEYSGRAFYQSTEFILGPNVIYLEPKIRVTQESLLYIVSLVNKLPYGGYDNYPTKRGIVEDILELPILSSEDTEPYWDYMAYFIHNIQQQYAVQLEVKSEYELDLMCQILGVTREDIAQRVEFTQPQYTNKFTVDEIFDIKSTKKAIHKNTIADFNGEYPYVTRKEGGNGVDSYINEDTQYLNPGNTITLARDTYIFYYQKEPYFTGDKIKIITYEGINETNALYMVTLLNKKLGGMTWGQTMSMTELNKIELELPVLAPNSKQIDWGAIRHAAVGGGINYLATRMEICNRDLAIIRQLIQ